MAEAKMKELEVVIPIALELDWPTCASVVADILEQHSRYGFTRFALACPGGGWRSVGYPPTDIFRERAELFVNVRDALAPHGITCGWWVTATVKSGLSPDFARMVKEDGTLTPFASCPLDPAFRERFAENVALFAKIAKPAFIYTEDDYSVIAAAGKLGCFCERHLQEFAKRQGRVYSREELVGIFRSNTEESFALLRGWCELMKDTLVGLSEAMRTAVDRDSPEIPIGYMQSGAADAEGDCTEDVCRAMAGPNHTPFSRICGASYGNINARSIPTTLYHPLYCRQHIRGDFKFLHETDTFPHTRFFAAGAHMRAIMGAVYSFGYEGSIFQTQQLLDNANEEHAYGDMFAKERARLNAVYNTVDKCQLKGVQLAYDPFWNTHGNTKSMSDPLWTNCVSRFGIPFTTVESDVAFWDERQAQYLSDEAIKKQLSKGLFLDGDAAMRLCARGYGAYLGVDIGEDVAEGPMRFDLGAREVICDPFAREGKGKNMPSAHMFSPGGNGILRKISVTDPGCEIVSEAYTFQRKYIAPAMTRFENRLGGRVVVMGMTLDKNNSQSLLNYRRQRLIQDLIVWCADEYVFVKEAPEVFTIMNEAVEPGAAHFVGMLTLINLCEDALNQVAVHLPSKWRGAKHFCSLDQDGEWRALETSKTDDGMIVHHKLSYLAPHYIMGVL